MIIYANTNSKNQFGFWEAVPNPMSDSHSHTDVEINFLFNGSVKYLLGDCFHVLPAEKIGLFWAGIPHQLVDSQPQTKGVWGSLPLSWFFQWNLPKTFMERLLHGNLLTESNGNESDIKLFKQWLVDFKKNNSRNILACKLELQARILRLAERMSIAEPISSSTVLKTGNNQHIINAIQYISQHYTEAIALKHVAKSIGLHPNYLMQLFQKHCGITILDYLTKLRIAHAQRLLLTSDLKIVDIALESGFGSLSRFHEVFLRVCNQTPRKYRTQIADR